MIKMYRDNNANAIFIEDANGVQFLNSLHATIESIGSDTIDVEDIVKGVNIVSNTDYSEFVDENDDPYGNTATEVCNELNSIFSTSGTPTNELPFITSSLTIALTVGETLNYELTANYGVGYEWDLSNVNSVTTIEGNIRKLIGGSSLIAGTYNIPVKAINYNGQDSRTIVLTVSNPPFSNTKSVVFQQSDWLSATGSLLSNTLGRSSNGAGSTDAWSISLYFKGGSSNNQNQTIFYFGANDITNANHLRLYWNGNNVTRQQLIFTYGSTNNKLKFTSPANTITSNSGWHHIMITYDGGTTGASSGSINSYYSRFKMFIDGVQETTTNTHNNYGISSAMNSDNLRIAKYGGSVNAYMRNSCKVDEVSVFDSDQSSNISSIYNSGIPFDLGTLGTNPLHWWRMGDGDTFPTLEDSIGSADFTMTNMTSSNIVSDVP